MFNLYFIIFLRPIHRVTPKVDGTLLKVLRLARSGVCTIIREITISALFNCTIPSCTHTHTHAHQDVMIKCYVRQIAHPHYHNTKHIARLSRQTFSYILKPQAIIYRESILIAVVRPSITKTFRHKSLHLPSKGLSVTGYRIHNTWLLEFPQVKAWVMSKWAHP